MCPTRLASPNLDKKESGLAPIACETFEGFVFINFAPAQSLETFLGPVAERLRGAPFGDYLYAGRISDTLNANWKLGLEAASEGYHVQVLHKNTAREMISWPGNPHVHYADWEPLGPHRNMIVDLNPTYKLPEDKPVQKFAFSSARGHGGERRRGCGTSGICITSGVQPDQFAALGERAVQLSSPISTSIPR